MNKNEQNEYVFSDEVLQDKPPRFWFFSLIVCFLISFVIWIYVANISTQNYEKTFSLIDIRIEGSELLAERCNLSVINIEESKVSVTVSGLRADISELTADDFSAYIDVRDISEAGRHLMDVSIDLPESVSLVSRTPQSVNISVDSISETEVDVVVKFSAYSMDLSYQLGEPITDKEKITVSGPQAILDRIDCAVAYIDLGTVTSGVVKRTEVVLVDGSENVIDSPYISFNDKSVTVTVPVTVEKNIPIKVGFELGADENDYESISLSQQLLRIKGDPGLVSQIADITIYKLDGKSEGIFTVTPDSVLLPEGIELVGQTTDIIISTVLKVETPPDNDDAGAEPGGSDPEETAPSVR